MSDPSPYAVAHRSNFADDMAAEDPYLPPGISFDLSTSTRYFFYFLSSLFFWLTNFVAKLESQKMFCYS